MLYQSLPMAAQTAYAEVLNQKQSADLGSLAGFPGSFHRRTVKSSHYWYFGYRDIDGASRMVYIGPDTERVRTLIERFNRQKKQDVSLQPYVNAAIALGCQVAVNKHFRIIARLAEYGIFRAGAVLIGTHAYNAIGNMLGVKWGDSSMTMDVDFAHAGNNVSLALPANISFDAVSAIESLEMGLLPIVEFSGKSGAQYRNPSDPELRIDFVTCMHRQPGPIAVANSNLLLEPLPFMEFSLEGITQGCILSRLGSCVVNIPSPGRFAIHKLIVYGERPISERVKANKDLLQAASLISCMTQEGLSLQLHEAWADGLSRGKGWMARAESGRAALLAKYPDLGDAFPAATT